MALVSSLVPRPLHVLTSARGPVDDADLLEHARRIAEWVDLPEGTVELVDLRDADLRRVTGSGVRRLAGRVQEGTGPRLRRVAIVADRDLSYGLARMYAAHMAESGACLEVFRDAATARAWLFPGQVDAEQTRSA